MVHQIEEGERAMSWPNLDDLAKLAQDQGKWYPF
jgi:hypothetical protein